MRLTLTSIQALPVLAQSICLIPMARLLPIRFWLPLLLVAGSLLLAPVFRASQPPLQSHLLALLVGATVALSGYLFAVIAQPERF